MPQSVGRRAYFRRALLKMGQARVNQAVHAHFALGPLAQLQSPGTGGVVTCTSSVDSRALPGSDLEQTVEADLFFDIGRTGELLYHEYSGSGHVVLRAAELHVRSKSPSRPMRV